MKSVGEVMAIGRTFKEALQKGLRGLEIGASGLRPHGPRATRGSRRSCCSPTPTAIFYVKRALDLRSWSHERESTA